MGTTESIDNLEEIVRQLADRIKALEYGNKGTDQLLGELLTKVNETLTPNQHDHERKIANLLGYTSDQANAIDALKARLAIQIDRINKINSTASAVNLGDVTREMNVRFETVGKQIGELRDKIKAIEADDVIQDFARRLSTLTTRVANNEKVVRDTYDAHASVAKRVDRLDQFVSDPFGTTVPVKKSGWVNIYRLRADPYKLKKQASCIGGVYATREEADKHQRTNGDVRVACVPIDWEEPT